MVLLVAYLSIFFDTINISLVQPIVPALVADLNSTTLQEGIYFSVYSVTMLISIGFKVISRLGMLIMGPLSDQYGRKPFLILSLLGDCIGGCCDYCKSKCRRSSSSVVQQHDISNLLAWVCGVVCGFCHSRSGVRL